MKNSWRLYMRKVLLTMVEQRKYDIIKSVSEGRMKKSTAEVKLNLSRRQINRLVANYQQHGKISFSHGNHRNKPAHALSEEMKNQVVSLYIDKYIGANFSHFVELLAENEGIKLSRSSVANILEKANILSPKAHRLTKRRHKDKLKKQVQQKRTAQAPVRTVDNHLTRAESHPSRPRKKYAGELVQMDASQHYWIDSEKWQLHIAVDDASGTILGAYFDKEETLQGYYQVYHSILSQYGIPAKFLTDRRTIFEYESKRKKDVENDTFTQFGYACHQLGTELVTTSVAQAKGRVERLFGTLQSRLTIELKLQGIKTLEEANAFLNSYIKKYNHQFACKIDYNKSVFEKAPSKAKLNLILGVLVTRKINSGHHFKFQNNAYLPIKGNQQAVYYPKGTEVLVIRSLNGELYVSINDNLFLTKRLLEHELVSKDFDEDTEPKKQKRQYIPPMSHPWKAASYQRYLSQQNRPKAS